MAALLFGFSTALAQRLPVFSPSAATLFQALPVRAHADRGGRARRPLDPAGRDRPPARALLEDGFAPAIRGVDQWASDLLIHSSMQPRPTPPPSAPKPLPTLPATRDALGACQSAVRASALPARRCGTRRAGPAARRARRSRPGAGSARRARRGPCGRPCPSAGAARTGRARPRRPRARGPTASGSRAHVKWMPSVSCPCCGLSHSSSAATVRSSVTSTRSRKAGAAARSASIAAAAWRRATWYSDWISSPLLGVKLQAEVRQPLRPRAGAPRAAAWRAAGSLPRIGWRSLVAGRAPKQLARGGSPARRLSQTWSTCLAPARERR